LKEEKRIKQKKEKENNFFSKQKKEDLTESNPLFLFFSALGKN